MTGQVADLAASLAATHARAMPARPWTTEEFVALLASPGVFLVGDARCFVLGRIALDEAEVLTLATDPTHRRLGLARAAILAFETTALETGARIAFLEVAADNHAALALYASAGWTRVGLRKGYYQTSAGRVDAHVLQRALTP